MGLVSEVVAEGLQQVHDVARNPDFSRIPVLGWRLDKRAVHLGD